MALEKLICPQCGGNDLREIGHDLYKCNFCGGTFKDEPDVPPVNTHTVAPSTEFKRKIPRDDGENTELYDDDTPSDAASRKTVAVVVFFIILIFSIFVMLKSCGETKYSSETPAPNMDSLLEQIAPGLHMDMPEFATLPTFESPTRDEKGITIEDLIVLDGSDTSSFYYMKPGNEYTIEFIKPKGLTRKNKKVSIGITYTLSDSLNSIYTSPDLGVMMTEGVTASHFTKMIPLKFEFPESSIEHTENYYLRYRIWDKFGAGEMTGTLPVYISK